MEKKESRYFPDHRSSLTCFRVMQNRISTWVRYEYILPYVSSIIR